MSDILINTGLGIMLLGAVYGLIIAIIGYRNRPKSTAPASPMYAAFQTGHKSPRMKTRIRIWAIMMIAGLLLTGVGISIPLS